MVLLIGGIKPSTIPALLAGIAWAIALPFFAADPQYIFHLYQDTWRVIGAMGLSESFDTSDFTAVFSALGWQLEPKILTIIRILSALATWAGALWLCSKLPRNTAAVALVIMGTSYMCLFNPRTEAVTYSILALPCAIVIATHLHGQQVRAWWIAAAAILVIAGCNAMTLPLLQLTKFWFKPSITIALLVVMAVAFVKTWADNEFSAALLEPAQRPNRPI